jgi:hypothetical protein
MKVIEPGHIYDLDQLDGDGKPLRITFVNREVPKKEHRKHCELERGGIRCDCPIITPHEGTQSQEVLRMTIDMMETLIDRTNHCDSCERWEGNDRIIKALTEAQRQMRRAILFHEERAMERKLDRGDLKPEAIPTAKDGHWTPMRRSEFEKFYGSPRGGSRGTEDSEAD